MSDLKQLELKKREIISNLEDCEVEAYVMSLAKKYYASVIKGDVVGIANVIESFNTIVKMYEDKYFDVSDYINYCLVISSNNLLKEVFDLNCSLWTSNPKSIDLDVGLNSLGFTLEASRKKIINDECNVKELYEMISSAENIDEAIIEKAFEVYSAFKIFNYGGEL